MSVFENLNSINVNGHTETHRKLTWRAARPLFERVEAAKTKTGIATTQELITVAVINYLKEIEG